MSSDAPVNSRKVPSSRHTSGMRLSSAFSSSPAVTSISPRSEEHTSELQSHSDLVCRLLLEKKKKKQIQNKKSLQNRKQLRIAHALKTLSMYITLEFVLTYNIYPKSIESHRLYTITPANST